MTLIDQVKRKLDITWFDENTDGRVADIIDSAAPVLRHKLGITDQEFDFSKPGRENMLFLALCLYEWNHCANEFDDNYANDIAQVRAKHEVDHYLAESEESENAEMICEQLYDLAKIQHAPLSPEAMTKFVARTNDIMLLLTK